MKTDVEDDDDLTPSSNNGLSGWEICLPPFINPLPDLAHLRADHLCSPVYSPRLWRECRHVRHQPLDYHQRTPIRPVRSGGTWRPIPVPSREEETLFGRNHRCWPDAACLERFHKCVVRDRCPPKSPMFSPSVRRPLMNRPGWTSKPLNSLAMQLRAFLKFRTVVGVHHDLLLSASYLLPHRRYADIQDRPPTPQSTPAQPENRAKNRRPRMPAGNVMSLFVGEYVAR